MSKQEILDNMLVKHDAYVLDWQDKWEAYKESWEAYKEALVKWREVNNDTW